MRHSKGANSQRLAVQRAVRILARHWRFTRKISFTRQHDTRLTPRGCTRLSSCPSAAYGFKQQQVKHPETRGCCVDYSLVKDSRDFRSVSVRSALRQLLQVVLLLIPCQINLEIVARFLE